MKRRTKAERQRAEREQAERKIEFDRAVARARAPAAAPAARRAAARVVPDLSAVVAAELAKQRKAEAEAAATAKIEESRCPTGGCRYCGVGWATLIDPSKGTETPDWFAEAGGHVCGSCHEERAGILFSIEADQKLVIVLRLIGRQHSQPLLAVGNPTLFAGLAVYWHEHPGAEPQVGPWGHVDVDSLRAGFEKIEHGFHGPNARPEPPPEPLLDIACAACGGQRWVRRVEFVGDRRREPIVCAGCDLWRPETDLGYAETHFPGQAREEVPSGSRALADDTCARLLGLWQSVPMVGTDPLGGIAEKCGFKWFWQTGRTTPNPQPWAHLDVERMRRRLKAAKVPA
jgi:hypothetical protein